MYDKKKAGGTLSAPTWDVGFVWSVARVLLAACLVALISSQVLQQIHSVAYEELLRGESFSMSVILLVIALAFCNWGFEALKWRRLVSNFTSISAGAACKSVLCGVALGIVTPARLGEYGGRLLGINAEHRGKALLANGVGSIAQNIANISIGLIAAIIYVRVYLSGSTATVIGLLVVSVSVLVFLGLLLSRLDLLELLLTRFRSRPWVLYLRSQSTFLKTYSTNDLLVVLVLGYGRYIVYTVQYVLLVMMCGVTDWPIDAVLGVAVIFFLQSGIPLPPILAVLARGEMAIFVWSVFSTNVTAILGATFLLWVINLVIPALLGALIIMKSRPAS